MVAKMVVQILYSCCSQRLPIEYDMLIKHTILCFGPNSKREVKVPCSSDRITQSAVNVVSMHMRSNIWIAWSCVSSANLDGCQAS